MNLNYLQSQDLQHLHSCLQESDPQHLCAAETLLNTPSVNTASPRMAFIVLFMIISFCLEVLALSLVLSLQCIMHSQANLRVNPRYANSFIRTRIDGYKQVPTGKIEIVKNRRAC